MRSEIKYAGMVAQSLMGNHEQLANQLQALFGKLETIPMAKAEELIKILEAGCNEALQIIVQKKVKFCWMIATRILRERGVKV